MIEQLNNFFPFNTSGNIIPFAVVATIIGYFLISSLCLRFPRLVFWQREKQWNCDLINEALYSSSSSSRSKLMNVGHRGGCRGRLENTIESFDNGLRCGANALEMDVCLTKDKQIVVIHDSSLLRMCGVDKHVEEYDYKDLPQFLPEIPYDFSVTGIQYSRESQTPKIPLLRDVFRRFDGVMINVEIKTPTEEFIKLMNELIKEFQREDLTIWGCKNPQLSKLLKKTNPKIKRFFSLGGISNLYFKYLTGLLPFCSIDEDSLQIPLYNREHYEWKKKEQKTLLQHITHRIYFLMIWILGSHFVSGKLYEHLKKRGVVVMFWVINEPTDFQRCIEYNGCVGIMTDIPSLLTSFLSAKQLHIKSQ